MPRPWIGSIPLFAGLDGADLDSITRLFQPAAYKPGDILVRQGQPADSALIIESGAAEVLTALPGGGTLKVAALGPGSMLGEMALLDSAARSATVVASTAVTGQFIERDGFRMLLAQRNRAAFVIQRRITVTLCQRLRELNAKIGEYRAPGNSAPAMEEAAGAPASDVPIPFDWRAFLPVLPVFRQFGAAEIAEFAGLASAVALERGQTLFRQGDRADSGYVVVRGAIEISGARNGHRHRIGILGPGKLCGTLALIEGQSHSMSAVARENSVLLEIGSTAFRRLYDGDDRVSARFQESINQELLQALARTNNHLTRLISQARIRGGHHEEQKAQDLQRALGAQDCRAA